MIEKIDRVLQFLENILLPLALAGHVGDRPERRAAGRDARQRLTRMRYQPTAAPPVSGGDRRSILDMALSGARRLRQPVNRLGDFRRTGKQPLDRHACPLTSRAPHSSI